MSLLVTLGLAVQMSLPVPPPMPKRSIAPPVEAPAGETLELTDADAKFTLFIPRAFSLATASSVTLTMHFHGATWFAIDEHLRRGLKEPLLIANLGEGSSVYQKAFQDRGRFGRLLGLVEAEMKKRGAPNACKVGQVDVSSFSAGYGAVRELLKDGEAFKKIQRIVLADSMYASFETQAAGVVEPAPSGPGRKPAKVHIQPWVEFAKAAVRGEKSFTLTHSQVPTETYANSALCAAALVEAVGGRFEAAGEVAAAKDPDYPLMRRCDMGKFHVWSYGGVDAQAHMTHARHIADVWLALDRAEKG